MYSSTNAIGDGQLTFQDFRKWRALEINLKGTASCADLNWQWLQPAAN